jgi:hypothetical protein
VTDVAALADRLYADALAAVLRDPAAFRAARANLTLGHVEEYAAERGLVYQRDFSITEAELKQAWGQARRRWAQDAFGKASDDTWSDVEHPHRAVTVIANTAVSLLQSDGRELILNVDRRSPGREILRWRFVSLAVPISTLVAAVAALSGRVFGRVRLLHPSMAPDGSVAHQHLHHAAMLSFEELWGALRMRCLLEPDRFRRSLRLKIAWCPGLHDGYCLRSQEDGRNQAAAHPVESAKHMEEWGDLLFNAFIARGLLDRHAGHGTKLERCDHPGCEQGHAAIAAFSSGRGRPHGLTGTPYPWPRDRYRLGGTYWEAHAEGVFKVSQKQRATVIQGQVAEERSILARAFYHVEPRAEQAPDEAYEVLLLQYLRVKTALHRLLVHPTGEHGLEKFLEHFSQIKVYEPRSDRLRPGKPDEAGLIVAATEYRVAPDAWLRELGRPEFDHRGKPRSIEDIPSGKKPGEAAWLIHFKRAKHDEKFAPLHGRSVRQMEGEAQQIGNALEQRPERLLRLRGIDICGVEEQQPLWVCAETLRKVRRRSAEIAARRPGLRLQPLRLTLHAGEDFRWLTSGMRAIAEPFYWKLIERGDRIGHGIAVTLEPDSWWGNHFGQVISGRAIDRLHDLAFLASYSEAVPSEVRNEGEATFNGGRSKKQQKWLADEVAKALKLLGLLDTQEEAELHLVDEVKKFWLAIGGRTGRRLLNSTNPPGEDAPLHERWLHRYFWNRRIQKRAAQMIELPVDESSKPECELLIRARQRLIRELARWQIPIESNPSSNLVVASLDAMASQQFLAQSVEQACNAGNETLPWTISTDDPITFATSLADEYAYAWAGMVMRENKAYDPAHARALLDQAAATSMRTRFTVPNEDG